LSSCSRIRIHIKLKTGILICNTGFDKLTRLARQHRTAAYWNPLSSPPVPVEISPTLRITVKKKITKIKIRRDYEDKRVKFEQIM
jgi:hypothetical protein